jgi:hypothetical protein
MQLLDFVICDDIREEKGNKLSLMGVYTATFEVPPIFTQWPYVTRLGFFIRLQLEEGENLEGGFEFRVIRDGQTRIKIDGGIRSHDPSIPFIIHFNLSPFMIKEPGRLDFEIWFLNKDKPAIIPLSSLNVTGTVGIKSPELAGEEPKVPS